MHECEYDKVILCWFVSVSSFWRTAIDERHGLRTLQRRVLMMRDMPEEEYGSSAFYQEKNWLNS